MNLWTLEQLFLCTEGGLVQWKEAYVWPGATLPLAELTEWEAGPGISTIAPHRGEAAPRMGWPIGPHSQSSHMPFQHLYKTFIQASYLSLILLEYSGISLLLQSLQS